MKQIASVLYYPHIEIKNDRWLKSILLFWDCVYRIVPSTYKPSDSPPVRVAVECGLVRPIILEAGDFSAICSEFKSFLKKLSWLPAGLEGSRTDRLHKEKIDAQLYPALERLATNIDPEGFLELPADLSRGYMMYLAKAISGRRNLSTVTDDRNAWTISPYFRERANFGEILYNRDAPAFYCCLIFNDLVPASLFDVDIRQIIRFVEKRRDERVNLRNTVCAFANEIAKCKSESHAADLRDQYVSRLEAAKTEFRKSMDFCSPQDLHALLTLGIPVAATVFGAFGLLGDPFDMWKVSSSILMGAVAAYAEQKKVKISNRRESDVSYLVDIDDELIKRNAIPRYDRIFEEFIND
jgi:hypothetical protein